MCAGSCQIKDECNAGGVAQVIDVFPRVIADIIFLFSY